MVFKNTTSKYDGRSFLKDRATDRALHSDHDRIEWFFPSTIIIEILNIEIIQFVRIFIKFIITQYRDNTSRLNLGARRVFLFTNDRHWKYRSAK